MDSIKCPGCGANGVHSGLFCARCVNRLSDLSETRASTRRSINSPGNRLARAQLAVAELQREKLRLEVEALRTKGSGESYGAGHYFNHRGVSSARRRWG